MPCKNSFSEKVKKIYENLTLLLGDTFDSLSEYFNEATNAKEVAVTKAGEASESATTATNAKEIAVTASADSLRVKEELLLVNGIKWIGSQINDDGELIFTFDDTSNVTDANINTDGELLLTVA